MRLAASLLVMALALPISARSTTIHVPADQPTIQAGINAAAFAGDTVLVAPGTYMGTGNKELNFKGKAIVLRSEGGAAATIIDCEQQGRGFYFQAGEGPASVVEGFTITNGRVSGPFPDGWGGGILCIGSSPTIRDCMLMVNEAANGSPGGGVACYDSSPRLITCAFEQNTSTGYGGGVYFRQSSPTCQGCIFASNSATYGGGMVAIEGSSPNLTDCSFTDNTADAAGGGAAFFQGSGGTMSSCFLTGNTTLGDGGGMSILGGGPVLLNCNFVENSALNSRGGGFYMFAAMPSFTGCTFEGNTAYEGGAASVISDLGATVSDCLFADNVASNNGGAIAYYNAGPANLTRCVFVSNEAQSGAGVASMGNSSPVLANCTLYGCRGSAISTSFTTLDTVRVRNSIIAFSPQSEAVACNVGGINLTCTDIYANLGGNWIGCIASQLGQNGNFSSNPLFCNATNRDFRIRATSPCAPGNSPPGCGLIGALPVACGVSDVADSPGIADQRLTVMPNPVRGVARFEFGPVAPFSTLNIFDSQGRLVEELQRQDGHWNWTPGSSFPAGVYFAKPGTGAAATGPVKFLYLR